MKKIALLLLAVLTLAACEKTTTKNNTYYLVAFSGDPDILTSSSRTHVKGNEYIKFSSNRIYWNNRNSGKYNTTYSFTVSGDVWYLTDVNGGDSYIMTILERTKTTLKTYSTNGYDDSFYRLWVAQ